MNGWISIDRKIQEKSWYKKSDYVHVWLHLLLCANHKPKSLLIGNKEIELNRGQVLTSRASISEKTGVQQNVVYRALKLFENAHQIEQQTTNKYTIITIVNYDKYQKNEQQIEQQMNSNRTANEQQNDTNNNINNVNNNIYNNNIIRTQNQNTNLFDFIESNFGRTLNPVEYEEISSWEDCDLTRYAIKQAVLLNKPSIRYISRILSSYKAENITTVQQAQNREDNFKSQIQTKHSNKITSKETLSEKLKRLEKEAQEYDRNEGVKND